MALPKALLCTLGGYDAVTEEAQLRKAGFATATVAWKEVTQQPNDWLQLSEVLQDEAIQAVVIAGEPQDITSTVYAMISLLILSLDRERMPALAFVVCSEDEVRALPPFLSHVKIYHSLDPFAAKLMAARFKPPVSFPAEFHLKAHMDPLLGLWMEVGVPDGETQQDFMVGTFEGTVTAFGIGKRGVLPGKTTLAYPMLGIKGEMGDREFSACASKDELMEDNACFCRIDGIPQGIFLCRYPESEEGMEVVSIIFG